MRTTIALLIFTALIASGCATQKRCLEKWPPQITPIETVTEIVYKDSVVYRDTIIEVEIPGDTDTAYIEIPGEILKTAYAADTVKTETELATAMAWIEPGPRPKLKIVLEQKPQLLQVKLDSAIRQANHWKNEVTKIKQTYTKVEYKQTGWQKFQSSAFWVFLAIIIIYIFLTYLFVKRLITRR